MVSRRAVAGAAIAAAAFVLYRLRRRRRQPRSPPAGWGPRESFPLAARSGAAAYGADGLVVLGAFIPWREVARISVAGAAVTVHTCAGGQSPPQVVEFADPGAAAQFARKARQELYGPRCRVHVLLNPFAGTKRGEKIYRTLVEPIFTASPHEVLLHVTRHGGHAREMAAQLAFSDGDVIAVVSGDGLVNEVINGLNDRGDGALRRLRIAHIPAGSGNGLAHSVGLGCVEMAAAAAVQGRVEPLDVFRMHFGGAAPTLHGFLSLTYAAIADVDIGSEWMRCLGDLRFTIAAALWILRRPSYRMALRWRCAGSGAEETHSVPLHYFLVANTSHLSASCGPARSQRPGSGSAQLQLLPAPQGLLTLVRFMIAVDDGEHLKQPAPVLCRDVVSVEGTPDPDRRLVLDGELVPSKPFHLEVLAGAGQLVVPR
eukprot:TRINITY_DN13873_c0_g1_i1.p1 TRINITY_DN13873_c0_g1~~TRINITY_DN13873_c0_g1_i1.p1  ORF type:complete len:453 (+),score=109.61 TRINITY_DN13873_c0_g1_i1:76-1359(+)